MGAPCGSCRLQSRPPRRCVVPFPSPSSQHGRQRTCSARVGQSGARLTIAALSGYERKSDEPTVSRRTLLEAGLLWRPNNTLLFAPSTCGTAVRKACSLRQAHRSEDALQLGDVRQPESGQEEAQAQVLLKPCCRPFSRRSPKASAHQLHRIAVRHDGARRGVQPSRQPARDEERPRAQPRLRARCG